MSKKPNLTLLAESVDESFDKRSKRQNVLVKISLVKLLRQAVPQVKGDVGDLVVGVAAAGLIFFLNFSSLNLAFFCGIELLAQ